jgi:hypothetical protein
LLVGGRYNKPWPVAAGDLFFVGARIPFVSVRPWTAAVGLLSYAKKHTVFTALMALPYGVYGAVPATTFGAYDTIGNDLSKVAGLACRAAPSCQLERKPPCRAADARRGRAAGEGGCASLSFEQPHIGKAENSQGTADPCRLFECHCYRDPPMAV